jgi:serine/threonine-protein kinase
VLRQELAAVLGWDRFLAEIRLTAQLDHPQIHTDRLRRERRLSVVRDPLWRGESLRDRLHREKQLGVAEALTIIKQIASGPRDPGHISSPSMRPNCPLRRL